MIFEPCTVIHFLDDLQQMKETVSATRSFGAPISLILRELDSRGMLDTVVEESGKIFISTELGGGGFVSPRTLSIAENGIRNILHHFAILPEIDSPALEITSQIEGMLVTRAGRAPVKHWDTIAVIASDFDVSFYE